MDGKVVRGGVLRRHRYVRNRIGDVGVGWCEHTVIGVVALEREFNGIPSSDDGIRGRDLGARRLQHHYGG